MRPVIINGLTLDITASSINHHRVFIGNEVFNVNIAFIRFRNFCASLITIFIFNFYQLFFDDVEFDFVDALDDALVDAGRGAPAAAVGPSADADDVEFSTGSVGLGPAMTLFASMVQDYLRHAGYETTHFADGQSALESIVAAPPIS